MKHARGAKTKTLPRRACPLPLIRASTATLYTPSFVMVRCDHLLIGGGGGGTPCQRNGMMHNHCPLSQTLVWALHRALNVHQTQLAAGATLAACKATTRGRSTILNATIGFAALALVRARR